MEAIDFVNSKDIREYWKEIGYEPAALESAWLIWQSKNHTVEEKHEAFKKIIDMEEDCDIPAGEYAAPQPSLHEFLKRYIFIVNNLISSFYKTEDNAVYSYRMYFDDEVDRDWYNVSSLFRTFDEAYAHFQDDGEPPHPNFVEFIKTYIGAEGKQIFVRFNLKNEIVRVDETNYLIDINEKEFEIFHFVFRELSFEFPIPFKKGDIIRSVKGMYTRPSCYYEKYVFESILKGNGYTVAQGYGVDGDGNIEYESIHPYMDFEYMITSHNDKDNILTPISKYLSDEIDLALLLDAYRYTLNKYESGMLKLHHLNYTKEKNKLAGVDNEP